MSLLFLRYPVRINKALSHLGICSRRNADKLINDGMVFVNGKACKCGQNIFETDIIIVNKKIYKLNNCPNEKIFMLYKPIGVLVSAKNEYGRKTVFDLIKTKERLISVGRLDINSEGLILLTNSPDFANYAESPKNQWIRIYKVRIFGNLTDNIIKQIEQGVIIDNIKYKPIKIKILSEKIVKNIWCECQLTEGKNREIRKIFLHFGILVNKLIRIKYGPYSIGVLKPGQYTAVPNYIKFNK